jgi:hypothetical protein
MPIDKTKVIAEIDRVLDQYNQAFQQYKKVFQNARERTEFMDAPDAVQAELVTLLFRTVERYAPNGRQYAEHALGQDPIAMSYKIKLLVGVLKALRSDYERDGLQTIREIIDAELFSDFLEQAKYLMGEGWKDAAAVMAGGVLEEHLRKLCDKISVPLTKPNGEPKTINGMNEDAYKASAYTKAEWRQVSAWADIRNNAAHGKYGEYTKEEVKLMVLGVGDFISRNPA